MAGSRRKKTPKKAPYGNHEPILLLFSCLFDELRTTSGLGLACGIAVLAFTVTSMLPPESKSNAGWRLETAEDEVACNIDRIDFNENWTELFLRKYYGREPVVLKGWRKSYVTELQRRVKRKAFFETFGHVEVSAGKPWELALKGASVRRTNLSDFMETSMVDRDGTVIFDRTSVLRETGMDRDWETLPGLDNRSQFHDWRTRPQKGPDLILSLGYDGSGLAFHFHSESYSLMLHGRKRWGIFAPHKMAKSGFAATEDYRTWLAKRSTEERPTWECVQDPGDLLYVPEGFYHATVNLGDAVSIVHQAAQPTPGTGVHAMESAMRVASQKKTAAALTFLRKAMEFDQSASEFWELSGMVCFQATMEPTPDCTLEEAVTYFTRASELNPLNHEALKRLALCLMVLHRHEDAMAVVESAVRRGLWLPELPGSILENGTWTSALQGEINVPEPERARRIRIWVDGLRSAATELFGYNSGDMSGDCAQDT